MEARNFEEDLKNSKKVKWDDALYNLFGTNFRKNYEDDIETQLNLGFDITLVVNKRKYTADLKTITTRAFNYNEKKWILEIKHHIYKDETKKKLIKSTDGWLYTSTADVIIYGKVNEKNDVIEAFAFTLLPFKSDNFKYKINYLKKRFASTKFSNGCYQLTILGIVDYDFIRENAIEFWEWFPKEKKTGGLEKWF